MFDHLDRQSAGQGKPSELAIQRSGLTSTTRYYQIMPYLPDISAAIPQLCEYCASSAENTCPLLKISLVMHRGWICRSRRRVAVQGLFGRHGIQVGCRRSSLVAQAIQAHTQFPVAFRLLGPKRLTSCI
jgi:hypothetical protein